jgi:hypothetical protein
MNRQRHRARRLAHAQIDAFAQGTSIRAAEITPRRDGRLRGPCHRFTESGGGLRTSVLVRARSWYVI